MATIKFRRGSGQPTGLTAYEPAWDTTNNRLFVNNGSTALWIGAPIVNDGTLSGNCAWTLPTQFSVKTYVDNQIGVGLCAGTVASVNGITGAVNIIGATGISVFSSSVSRGITLSINSDVAVRTGPNIFSGIQSFSGGISGDAVSSLNRLTIKAGFTASDSAEFLGPSRFATGVSLQGPVDITGTLRPTTGSLSVAGGINVTSDSTFQKNLDIDGALRVTGGATLGSLYVPGSASIDGNVTLLGGINGKGATFENISVANAIVRGNLTVNGTTTTVNSTTITIQDPLIAIGGITGNAPPPVGDTKDRGIVFQWADGVAGRTGFFGFDQSAQRFTFISQGADVSGEIVSGAIGSANLAGVFAPSGTLTLSGVSAANATILLAGNTAGSSTTITHTAAEHIFSSSGDVGKISIIGDPLTLGSKATFTPAVAYTATRTYTLPDISGQMVLADTAGATSGWLLRGQGAATQNTWIDPTSSGFTAYTSLRNNLVAVKDGLNYGLVFALGTAGNQILYGDSTTGIAWQPSTNTLTVGSGTGKLEGVVDGGAF